MAQPKPMKGGPGRRPMGPPPKIDHPVKTFMRLIKYSFGSYPVLTVIVFICLFISTIAQIRGMMFLQELIDDCITPLIGQANPDFSPLINMSVKVGVVFGASIVCSYVQSKLMIYITQGSMRKMRVDLFSHMEKLPISYFDTHSHGDIMSIYTNDIDATRQMISQSLIQLVSSVISIVGTFIGLIMLSPLLTLVTVFMIIIMVLASKTIAQKSTKHFVDQQSNLGAVNGYIEEMMEGQKVVKVFNHEKKCQEEFDELNEKLFKSASTAGKLINIMGPVNGQLGHLSFVLVSIVGGFFAINNVGSFTVGALASFLTLNKSINMPISQVSQQFNMVIMALAGADRVFKLLDEPAETDDGYVTLVNAKYRTEGDNITGEIEEVNERTGIWAWKHYHQADGTITYTELKGDVVFDDVDFGYVPEKTVLHNIDLFATPGQKIAFVGSTGAGKTTITNLINRFYDIQDGKIRYDGINVNKIKKDDLRRSLGMVLQDTHLFTGTVRDNIKYGKLDATEEEVIAAAKLANAHGFISRLPKGYDTVITGDGASLSQGQRQLLAIARAAIADPPVLILDEATSSIDTRTEKLVQEGMDKLMSGRTTFVIAHRLSTVKNADCIMVLENGCIIERGTHDELIEAKGKYYSLYTGNKVTA